MRRREKIENKGTQLVLLSGDTLGHMSPSGKHVLVSKGLYGRYSSGVKSGKLWGMMLTGPFLCPQSKGTYGLPHPE